jgi:hypothetical protein
MQVLTNWEKYGADYIIFEILKYLCYRPSIRANPFSGICLVCDFVGNRIYVKKIEVLL